jgi:thiol:disulfide interchange protein DsbD
MAHGAADQLKGYTMARVTRFVGPEEFVRFLEGGADEGAGQEGMVTRLLDAGNLLLALPLIFLLGLALNLTPCVYPIIPITVSYFGAQAGGAGNRPFVLALFYVLGMALMYSGLGVAAGLTGGLFGSQLQNPWVLLAFALVMFGLALSQFDRRDGRPIWEFQLPGFLRNRAQSRSGVLGALAMGLTVGVVAAPCIGPAVIALLQWVGTQQSPVMGFAVFFSLALGLGLPYLFLATASGGVKSLPRAGEWMVGVKHIFGVVLIWMGAYYVQTPIALWHPVVAKSVLVAVSALSALYLIAIDRSGGAARGFAAVRRLAGLAAIGVAAWLLVPAPADRIQWRPYTEQALAEARQARRPVLIDFTAQWCAACKELEHKTFSDERVGRAARRFVALRGDLTNFGGGTSRRWRDTYGIKGLPTIVLLEPR